MKATRAGACTPTLLGLLVLVLVSACERRCPPCPCADPPTKGARKW